MKWLITQVPKGAQIFQDCGHHHTKYEYNHHGDLATWICVHLAFVMNVANFGYVIKGDRKELIIQKATLVKRSITLLK